MKPAMDSEEGVTLNDYIAVVRRYKRLILGMVAAGFFLSAIISLLIPKSYTASASILPPTETQKTISSILSQNESDLGGIASSLMGNRTTADLYVGILRSRTVGYRVIEKFDLQKVYDVKYKEDALKKLLKKTNVEVSKKSQIINIYVEDRISQRAADIANTYVELLDRIIRKLNVTEGQRKRSFLEDRLKGVEADLVKAETDVKRFQEEHQAVAIEEQARVAIESAAKLKEEMLIAQTELEVLKKFGTERQNEAVMLKTKIEEFQKHLNNIESGHNPKEKSDAQGNEPRAGLYIPFNELPEVGMSLVRLTREAKIQEKIFELLTAQYELAKIDEAKDVKTIKILDEAIPPERKSSPKRTRIVLVWTIFSLFAAIFTAFVLEYVGQRKE